MKLRIQLLFLLLVVFFVDLSAQVSVRFKDVGWDNDPMTTVVPENWMDLDAVCLERKFTYDFNNAFSPADRQSAELYVKLSLRSQSAIENFRFIPVPNLRGVDVTAIDARITKLDGRVIDLRSKFLKRHEWEESTTYYSIEQYRLFEVPVLEPGDQFEYIVRFANFPFPERFYFQSNLPTVQSVYELIALTRFNVLASSENGAPEPKVDEEFYSVKRSYRLDSLEPLIPLQGCLMHEVYPNVRHVVQPSFMKANFWPSNWGSFYRQIDQTQYRLNRTYDARMEETLRIIWDSIPEGEQLDKVKHFHHYANQHLEIVKRRPDAAISFGNDMRYGQTTAKNLILMYDDIFRRFDIPYRMVWAGDRFKGSLDTTLLSDRVTPHKFFAVFVGGDTLFITPKNETRTYGFDELPPEANGQNAIWFYADDSFKYDFAPIRKSTQSNYRLVTVRSSPAIPGTFIVDEQLYGDYKFYLAPFYLNKSSILPQSEVFSSLRTRPSRVESAELSLYTDPSNEFAGFNYLQKETSRQIALAHWVDFYALELLKYEEIKTDCMIRYPLYGTEEYHLVVPKLAFEKESPFSRSLPGMAEFKLETEIGEREVTLRYTLTIEVNELEENNKVELLSFLSDVKEYLNKNTIVLSER
jgi:hypothetical protein